MNVYTAVARELNPSTGTVTHYFVNKRELVSYALNLLDERSAARPRLVTDDGLPALRAAAQDMLPLTPDRVVANRVWVSSWDAALADEELRIAHAERYAASRSRMRTLIRRAQAAGHIPRGTPTVLADQTHSFVLGLIVQALLDPGYFTPRKQVAELDAYMDGLKSGLPNVTLGPSVL